MKNIDQTKTEETLKEASNESVTLANPLMVSSQVNVTFFLSLMHYFSMVLLFSRIVFAWKALA